MLKMSFSRSPWFSPHVISEVGEFDRVMRRIDAPNALWYHPARASIEILPNEAKDMKAWTNALEVQESKDEDVFKEEIEILDE